VVSAPWPLVAPAAQALRVSGNRLLDRSGRVVHLHGVNRSGPECARIQGWGIFDARATTPPWRDAAGGGRHAPRRLPGVIVIPGIDYANDVSKCLSHEPRDPLHQLVAEAHVYGKNTCDTTS
jgi:hypothetical protein